MKIFKFNEISDELKNLNAGLIIGNFDGVHIGHQKLLRDFVSACLFKKLKSIVFTLNPHPFFYFEKKNEPYLIQGYSDRYAELEKLGVDYIIELDFNAKFQKMTAQEFISKYFQTFKNTKLIHVGYDFSIGADLMSSLEELKKQYDETSVEIVEERSYSEENEIISSTLIRNKLKLGKIQEVNKLLNRPFKVLGRVISGKGLGAKELLPTANILPSLQLQYPKNGVYYVQVSIGSKVYNGLTNIGVNPTVDTSTALKIETYLIDLKENIYGLEISICFLDRLRNEVKFDSIEKLREQLSEDIEKARKYFE